MAPVQVRALRTRLRHHQGCSEAVHTRMEGIRGPAIHTSVVCEAQGGALELRLGQQRAQHRHVVAVARHRRRPGVGCGWVQLLGCLVRQPLQAARGRVLGAGECKVNAMRARWRSRPPRNTPMARTSSAWRPNSLPTKRSMGSRSSCCCARVTSVDRLPAARPCRRRRRSAWLLLIVWLPLLLLLHPPVPPRAAMPHVGRSSKRIGDMRALPATTVRKQGYRCPYCFIRDLNWDRRRPVALTGHLEFRLPGQLSSTD